MSFTVRGRAAKEEGGLRGCGFEGGGLEGDDG